MLTKQDQLEQKYDEITQLDMSDRVMKNGYMNFITKLSSSERFSMKWFNSIDDNE